MDVLSPFFNHKATAMPQTTWMKHTDNSLRIPGVVVQVLELEAKGSNSWASIKLIAGIDRPLAWSSSALLRRGNIPGLSRSGAPHCKWGVKFSIIDLLFSGRKNLKNIHKHFPSLDFPLPHPRLHTKVSKGIECLHQESWINYAKLNRCTQRRTTVSKTCCNGRILLSEPQNWVGEKGLRGRESLILFLNWLLIIYRKLYNCSFTKLGF